jgi:hypothetical protein
MNTTRTNELERSDAHAPSKDRQPPSHGAHEAAPPQPFRLDVNRKATTEPTKDEIMIALREAETGLKRMREERDHAILTLRRCERDRDITRETLASRDEEVQQLTLQLEAQTDSTTVWHGKYKQQLVQRRNAIAEYRALLKAQSAWWRAIWSILRGRALRLNSTHLTKGTTDAQPA